MAEYKGQEGFRHDGPDTTGVLIVNLGTPESPDRRSVRRYLKQFLSDPRVVEFPRALWWLILNIVILNIRPARSAEAYRKIWTDNGSPLLDISRRQADGVRALLKDKYGDGIAVALGMRYGRPSIAEALDELAGSAPRNLVVLPLYPQYSGSTTGSVFDEVADCLKRWRWVPGLRFIGAYHDNPTYIEALAASVRHHREQNGGGDHLLMSFHGVPKRYLLAGDPYHCHCCKTARLLAENLGLADDEWTLAFQSRFGREEWLRPYCDDVLSEFPGRGISNLDVICPGFATDCLETLEEVDMQYRKQFIDSGGIQFNYIPCLNDREEHLGFLSGLIEEPAVDVEHGTDGEQLRARLARPSATGAKC